MTARQFCAVPGCGKVLESRRNSGVCFRHRHTFYCSCVQCLGIQPKAVRKEDDRLDGPGMLPRDVMDNASVALVKLSERNRGRTGHVLLPPPEPDERVIDPDRQTIREMAQPLSARFTPKTSGRFAWSI